MRTRFIASLLLWFCLNLSNPIAAATAEPDAEVLFNQANAALMEGDYVLAIERYESILTARTSAALQFNLAVAHQRKGNPGHAVLHYERALLLQPGHAQARANLRELRRNLNLSPIDQTPAEILGRRLPEAAWTWGAAGAFWLGASCWILPPLFRRKAPGARIAGGALLLLVVLCLGALYGNRSLDTAAIVLADDTPLRVSPTPAGVATDYVHAGSVPRIVRSHQDFHFVRLAQRSGWVRAEEIVRLRER